MCPDNLNSPPPPSFDMTLNFSTYIPTDNPTTNIVATATMTTNTDMNMFSCIVPLSLSMDDAGGVIVVTFLIELCELKETPSSVIK